MSFEGETKEKPRTRKPKKVVLPNFSYHVVEVSEEELKRRLNRAYDILFTRVYKKMYGVDKLN
jgi:hypothetical protein